MVVFLMKKNIFSYAGYLPLYALALYVVYSVPNGITVQCGVYAVGVGVQECFYPTWVVA